MICRRRAHCVLLPLCHYRCYCIYLVCGDVIWFSSGWQKSLMFSSVSYKALFVYRSGSNFPVLGPKTRVFYSWKTKAWGWEVPAEFITSQECECRALRWGERTCPVCWQGVWYSALWHRSFTRWCLGRKFSSCDTSFPSTRWWSSFLSTDQTQAGWKLRFLKCFLFFS